jgi:hypothetical protein
MKTSLQKLESWLENWIEGSIDKMVGTSVSPAVLASKLAGAMEDGLITDDREVKRAPDYFQVSVHPNTLEQLNVKIPDLREYLSSGLYEAATSQDFLIASSPKINFFSDPSLSENQIIATAWHQTSPLDQTIDHRNQNNSNSFSVPDGAFLIVDGDYHFQLDKPVVNIGRRRDNQLVLSSSLVSRLHAQIRVRNGRFVIFDVGSKSGTLVHDHPVKQHILQPGDVVTIADVHLVYGEDPKPTPDETVRFGPIG